MLLVPHIFTTLITREINHEITRAQNSRETTRMMKKEQRAEEAKEKQLGASADYKVSIPNKNITYSIFSSAHK